MRGIHTRMIHSFPVVGEKAVPFIPVMEIWVYHPRVVRLMVYTSRVTWHSGLLPWVQGLMRRITQSGTATPKRCLSSSVRLLTGIRDTFPLTPSTAVGVGLGPIPPRQP